MSILKEGENCWRKTRAGRVGYLVDAADYFKAFARAARHARHRIFIAAWDIDSRVQLERRNSGHRQPASLGDFLNALADRRPDLNIYILAWDFPMMYLREREWLPVINLGWKTHRRVSFHPDDQHPIGASQHQKFVIIDDRVAFCGGIDLTKNRWDTPEHLPGDSRRCDKGAKNYAPFHDVQMIVDGQAAKALGDQFRERWQWATGKALPGYEAGEDDCWPSNAAVEIEDASVGVARTLPVFKTRPEVREVETLHLDSILAAVTTSLPEEIGAERNWDYRFCWVRDASMNIAVLTALGHHPVAKRFLDFILDVIPYKDEKIQIMYGINGKKNLSEKILPNLQGYENSQPVRIGNAAYQQKQNDIFGVLLDIIYQYLKIFKRSTVENREDLWTVVRTLGRHVERNWMKKDRGIWEFRGWKKHYTFSKVLCWVAMDRAMKIARYFSMDSYVSVWDEMRQKIRRDILKKGWDADIGAFVQAYGEKHLDAANLLMEHYGFIEASDPRYVNTVIETHRQLGQNGLMYRYRNQDDFGSPRSSFTVCTFWMVKSLYRIGRQKEAQILFDKVLSYRNHLGLLSEDIDFDTKRLLGNFPQGYSHLALIDAAITLAGEDISEPDK